MTTPTDEQIVLKIQSGDSAAFEQLYWRYKDRVIGVVYNIVRNQQDTLEISQEVFVRIYKNIDKYQLGVNLFTWIYRIAHNLAIDKYRHKKAAKEIEFDNDYQKNFTQPEDILPPSLGINPERAYERLELRQVMAKALDSLTENQRAIITLREIEGLSYDEIANTLGIPIGTVMSRIHYARLKLQNTLREYLECRDLD